MIILHSRDEAVESQRAGMTFSKSRRWKVPEPGFRVGSVWLRILCCLYPAKAGSAGCFLFPVPRTRPRGVIGSTFHCCSVPLAKGRSFLVPLPGNTATRGCGFIEGKPSGFAGQNNGHTESPLYPL